MTLTNKHENINIDKTTYNGGVIASDNWGSATHAYTVNAGLQGKQAMLVSYR
jgi:hypothetical protein